MSRTLIALVVFSIVIGLSFHYWRGMPFFLVPLFAISLNLAILTAIFPSLISQMEKSKNIWTTIAKWVFWIGSTGYMFLLAGYHVAWRSGILKFACMQEFTPAMNAQLEFLNDQFTYLTCRGLLILVVFNIVLLLFKVKFKDQSAEKLQAIKNFASMKRGLTAVLITALLILMIPVTLVMDYLAVFSLTALLYVVN